jgi:hypothetical protein
MAFINIPGNANPILIFSGTSTGAGTTTFVHDLGVEANYPGELYPAVFIFAITDIVGSFSGLQVNLEWSPITPDVGTPQFQTVGTWTPLVSPVVYFACSASGVYRLNCTVFSGGTSFNAYVSIASTMPQGTGGGGGGGSVTQGTVPWIDNIADVAGVALGATAVVPYGSTPAAVNVPGVNAFITNAGSIGAGVQFADNAASGATPTGTLEMGWDSVNSKIRALKVDASQNLLIAINAPLPAGTNVIGHVIVDSGSITVSGSVSVSNFPATQNVAGTTSDGTTTETNFLVVGGESNDATAQYQPIPLGAGGRSVIVEGVSAIATAVTGNPVFVGGEDGTGNLQALPIATINTATTARVVSVGGQDAISGKAVVLAFTSGALATSFINAAPFLISNTGNICFAATPTGVGGAHAVAPYVYSQANTAWSRLADAGVTGTVGVGGAAASGTAKGGNPVQIGGVFNATQPTATTGQVVEAQSTARGALIVATGVDSFVVTDTAAEASLSTLTTGTIYESQIIDALNFIIAHLKLLNRNIASSIPGADSEPDSSTGV